MNHHEIGIGAFEFVRIASLRAAQLMRGCEPRVDARHKKTRTAQLEVAMGKVTRIPYEKGPAEQ